MMDSRFTPEIIALARATALKWQTSAAVQLAQWADESAFGTKPSGTYNYFGIKATAGQSATTKVTHEQLPNGTSYVIAAGFANYPSAAAGFDAYGRLLGLGRPYRKATSTWMASNRYLTDIQLYVQGIKDAGYATATNYVKVITDLILNNNLAQLEPTPAQVAAFQKDGTMPTEATVTPTVTPATPGPVITAPAPAPVAAHETAIQVGDALQVLWQLADAAAEAAAGAIEGLLPQPIKTIVTMFFAPTVIQGYIHQAFAQLETVTKGQSVQVDTSNTLVAMVVNAINQNEPALVGQLQGLESLVQPLVTAFLAKVAPAA